MAIPIGLKKTAAMVVLRHERQFLLLKRNKAPHIGKYVPVGGKLEPFEDPHTAAKRETLEETGIRVSGMKYAGVLIETSPIDYNWQCNIYVVDIAFRPPPFCDEGELEWIAFEDLERVPTPPTDWHIYQYILRAQPFAFNAIYDEGLNLVYMVEEIDGVKCEV